MTVYSSYDEDALIRRLQQGDNNAFTEIYNRFWKLLFAIAFKYMENKEAAEEIVQEIFMRLWDRRNELDIKALGPYLATACKYAVFKQIAKDKLRREKTSGLPSHWRPCDNELESLIHARFLEQILSTAIDSLPTQCKIVYRLSEEDDLKIPEIASKLRISSNTARNHLARARQIIRSTLREAGASMLLF